MINHNPPAAPDPTLLDTPDDEIKWEAMTAFIEYYENITINASGYRWFCVVGSTRLGDAPDATGKWRWEYWFRASPFRWSDGRYGERDESLHQGVTHFATMADAQTAAVAHLRRFRETDTRQPRTLSETPQEYRAPEAPVTISGEARVEWKDTKHVVALANAANDGIVVLCERCRTEKPMAYPLGYWTFVDALKAFAANHVECEENQ